MISILKSKKNNRYASFTFDDALIDSAYKIDKLIYPYKATFYIVTGWLKPNPIKIEDIYNIGVDHGDIKQWQELSSLGHEIGSHTVSHVKVNSLNMEKEYFDSLSFIKKFHKPPYSLAMPYCLKPITPLSYDSIRLGQGKKNYNSLKKINFSQLNSFDPVENRLSVKEAFKIIDHLPASAWLIFRAHGLDGEGYCPWQSEYLEAIYKFLLSEKFQIKTMAEMTAKFK